MGERTSEREDATDPRFEEVHNLPREVERLRDITAKDHLAAADGVARDRGERLARILSHLVQTVLPNDVTTVILNVVAEALGASAGSVSLLSPDGKTIETPSFIGDMSPEAFARFRTLPANAPVAAADAIRTGSAVFIETREALANSYPSVHATTALREGARCAVPLAIAGRVLGSLNLGFPTWRLITDDERAFIRAAADQCALALERARLFDAERRARREAEVTAELTKLLFRFADIVNRAEGLQQIYEPALDVVIGALHVDRASVLLFDSDGVMRFTAARGLSETYCKAVEGLGTRRDRTGADSRIRRRKGRRVVHVSGTFSGMRGSARSDSSRSFSTGGCSASSWSIVTSPASSPKTTWRSRARTPCKSHKR
jgi:GAF domain-containing protein